MNIAVTTSKNPKRHQNVKAIKISNDLNLPLINRDRKSIESLLNEFKMDYILIVERDRLLMKSLHSEFFWHPGTAVKKLWEMNLGKQNSLVKAATIVGPTCKIVGVEANEYISYLTHDGLNNYTQVRDYIKTDMKRIQVINTTYESFLSKQADNSFDVVYFDPMFRMAKQESHGINGLRDFAVHNSLSNTTLQEALRVCKNRVVVKERIGGGVFKELGITKRIGEIKFGSVVYGYIEK